MKLPQPKPEDWGLAVHCPAEHEGFLRETYAKTKAKVERVPVHGQMLYVNAMIELLRREKEFAEDVISRSRRFPRLCDPPLRSADIEGESQSATEDLLLIETKLVCYEAALLYLSRWGKMFDELNIRVSHRE